MTGTVASLGRLYLSPLIGSPPIMHSRRVIRRLFLSGSEDSIDPAPFPEIPMDVATIPNGQNY